MMWLGHATAVVATDKVRLIVDPFGRRRAQCCDSYEAVLITHSHVDHLNRWTLKKIPKDADLYVPKGAHDIVSNLGFRSVTEVEPGDEFQIGDIDIEVVPTRHDGGRWSKGDQPICLGYLFKSDGIILHHAGDVDMSDFDVFEDIAKKSPVHTTLLPIGGMLPVWYYRMRRKSKDKGIHIDPDTALEIAGILQADKMIPIHWGTLNLRLGPSKAPKWRLQKVAERDDLAHQVEVLSHGQVFDVASGGVVPNNTDDADDAHDEAHD